MAIRQPIDPAWWDQGQFDGVHMRQILADRNIRSVFQFLHNRGWSWSAIAQATDIGEQRIREIANGRRRIENYDVYIRIATGLEIPRDYLGVGLKPLHAPTTAPAPSTVATVAASPGAAFVPAAVAEEHAHEESCAALLESPAATSWADRRKLGHTGTNLVLVAGFAGSGKTEFARTLSALTGWALLDKDVLTRPLVESTLTSLGGGPNDRHTKLYRTQVRPIAYRCLANATFANIDNGVSTVVTASFLDEVSDTQWLQRLLHRCDTSHTHLEVVWVGADADTMHTCLQKRDAARDTWKLNHWDQYIASIDLELRPLIPHLYIDNSLETGVKSTAVAHNVFERLHR